MFILGAMLKKIFKYLECTDTSTGITDTFGEGCDTYWTNADDCGEYDGPGFAANSMCCACGGGTGSANAFNGDFFFNIE